MGNWCDIGPVTVHRTLSALAEDERIPRYFEPGGVTEAHKRTKGLGVTVAVVDTGVDYQHCRRGDLADSLLEYYDAFARRANTVPKDLNGHGTHCAGIIAARGGNRQGLVGVAPECRLLSVRVLNDRGSGPGDVVAHGIDHARDRGADVINLSLGSEFNDPEIGAAVDRANAAGIPVVAAAGNSAGRVGWPAARSTAISVAAVDSTGKPAPFSCYGPEVNVAAPGVRVWSTYRDGSYAELSGTSMAAPAVSGVLALVVSAYKRAGERPTVADLVQQLEAAALDLGPAGRDDRTGAGLARVFLPSQVLPPEDEPTEPGGWKREWRRTLELGGFCRLELIARWGRAT